MHEEFDLNVGESTGVGGPLLIVDGDAAVVSKASRDPQSGDTWLEPT